ncbi:DUF2934 domain-containing protein [Microvirga massiliensis]|uniref:DUF2934 domain-containing protein n=1 Tax=Microvirga massiliensis TaxID=1033741 RepID=UPI000660ECEE|nr:DUF2934 domain-containing protein [Microvirga massiliensis]
MTDDFEQLIRERAYQLWEQEGRVDGRAEEHWHTARRELAARPEAQPVVDSVSPAEPAASEPAAKRPRRRASPQAAVAAEAIAPKAPRRRRPSTPTLQ